jgi:hypothetical protein
MIRQKFVKRGMIQGSENFRVLHYSCFYKNYSNQLTVNHEQLTVNSYEAVKCKLNN